MPFSTDLLLERIVSLELRMREFILQRVANIVQTAPLTITTENGDVEAVKGRLAVVDSQRGVRRYQHSGFRSRPPANSDAVFLLCEGGATKAIVVAENDRLELMLDSGEAMLYSPTEPTCTIRLDKSGKIIVTSAAAQAIEITAGAGANVILNGGVLKVARLTDQVTGTAGPYPLSGAVISTPGAANVLA